MKFFSVLLLIILSACTQKPTTISKTITIEPNSPKPTSSDPFEWLEEVESSESLKWVTEKNVKSDQWFKGLNNFNKLKSEANTILTSEDRIPAPFFIGDTIYNFWQDSKHKRGILRRQSKQDYLNKKSNWETVLDIDDLAAKSKTAWVYKGIDCLPEKLGDSCLISLSSGGSDAVVLREFDLKGKKFVNGGFFLPEAKSRATWIDADTIIVGTQFPEGKTLTTSGYPRVLKIWKRNTPLTDAQTVFEGKETDMVVSPTVAMEEKETKVFISQYIDFYNQKIHRVEKDLTTTELKLPTRITFHSLHKGFMILSLDEDWKVKNRVYVKGSLVAVADHDLTSIEELFRPDPTYLDTDNISVSKSGIYFTILDKVTSHLSHIKREENRWSFSAVGLPKGGNIALSTVNEETGAAFAEFKDFLTPNTQYYMEPGKNLQKVNSLPAQFDSSKYEVYQQEATSLDGTKIPYFVIGEKGAQKTAKPTLLYGYGGFLIPLTPSYLSLEGKLWLEKGGRYVVANIRGGGEFGAKWHQAAILKNKRKSYEDFIAVAEDLISRGQTTSKQLGIRGGSNGGLLVATVTTMRPDLFGAVVCQVPLIDMLRYHKLLAGYSWMAEYGNPEVEDEKKYIESYSPYQNLKAGTSYPEIFVTTSTKDDRVHPGHARKFVAKIESLGQPVLYYENTEGGHAGASTPEQRADLQAKIYSYLIKKLF